MLSSSSTMCPRRCIRPLQTLLSGRKRPNSLHQEIIKKCSISSSSLTIERTTQSKLAQMPKKEDLKFGVTFTDHMLMVEWDIQNGWGTPSILPFGDLRISPAASALHYGMECFEGTKAYKSLRDGQALLFRPELNAKRLRASMERLSLPGTSEELENGLVECLKAFVDVERDWIPSGRGYSLYLRPTVVATDPALGMGPCEKLLLYVIASPVGPYYKDGFKPVRLTADTSDVRAWPGGTGGNKVGGNYGPTMRASAEAASRGYHQVLWVHRCNETGEDQATEVGSMNVFFVRQTDKIGGKELVTAPLDRGDILPGVTRRSILELARSWTDVPGLEVVERYATMTELLQKEDQPLLEAFGSGTAAVVSPVECLQYKGVDYDVPAVGPLTQRFWDELTAIQYGEADFFDDDSPFRKWSVPVS